MYPARKDELYMLGLAPLTEGVLGLRYQLGYYGSSGGTPSGRGVTTYERPGTLLRTL
jgi:hypothetical protein